MRPIVTVAISTLPALTASFVHPSVPFSRLGCALPSPRFFTASFDFVEQHPSAQSRLSFSRRSSPATMSVVPSTTMDTNSGDESGHEFDNHGHSHDHSHNDDGAINEFDIDGATSIDELATLLFEINGATLTAGLSLSDAKEEVWAYVEDMAPDDIDGMCLEELSALVEELAPGVQLPDDGKGLVGARDFVWDLMNRAAHVEE